ncbi:hypothetical protein [Natranaerobius trueperi]|uniref:Small, acid-soluble spore protein, alpha/beta type n=1 Tax=Natranaerobius trueperi TaxID=759412 RepID=A0A226BZR2_9FIRM|nr:hypothetical protein [Natranaerobius trueperi]OWZ83587.1 hypothetical protein CDO51_07700 [Natranaerobius trueperi]
MKDENKEKLKEYLKWKTAIKMGLGGKVLKYGWSNLTAEESGKIGGIVSRKLRERDSKNNVKNN